MPNSSRLSHLLHADVVLDAFFLHALLRDFDENNHQLSLPHTGLQRHRFDCALDQRNYRMAGTGQEMWAHACDKCMYTYQGDDGNWCKPPISKVWNLLTTSPDYVSAGVTDGVTLGHPCCSIHDCTIPLASQQHLFCPAHANHQLLCCIQNCSISAEKGYRTCREPSHRAFEISKNVNKSALTMLRGRLVQAGLQEGSVTGSGVDSTSHTQLLASTNPSAVGNNSQPSLVKGRISRRWTHNEQLFVRCCDVIISHATFFGSEGVSGVKVLVLAILQVLPLILTSGQDFLKVTFPPDFPGSLPSYIFYDNNRNLVAHLLNTQDHYFDKVGLPVDVFHAKTKHSETDRFAQLHCNPARYGELIDENDQWIFNSSAAELTNKWFGAFQPIVREMPVPK
jgi:hypothetical protein